MKSYQLRATRRDMGSIPPETTYRPYERARELCDTFGDVVVVEIVHEGTVIAEVRPGAMDRLQRPRPTKCPHLHYRTRIVDRDQHQIAECVYCGEPLEL